ncbi:MAG: hypothetical protein HYY91_03760 [Candidatus Omnitrophica bacterium]|nr:hypothetical protein [Candidatus Omnitrophota bacterium]
MSSTPVLAIDVGSTKVACVIGRPQASPSFALRASERLSLDIMGAGLAEYAGAASGWPVDPPVLARALEQALEATRVADIPSRAVVSLTHPHLSHTTTQAQIDLADEPATIRNRDLQRLSRQAVSHILGVDRDVLQLIPLGYAGNGFEAAQDPRGLTATRLSGSFQLVSIPTAVTRAVVQALDAVGLEAERFLYSLQAVAAAALEGHEPQRIVLLDIGGWCTDLAVVEQGRLCATRSLAWGAATVVEAVAQTCRLTSSQALAATLEGAGSRKPHVRETIERQLDTVQAGLRELLAEGPRIERMVVTGRGALIDGVVERLGRLLELKAVLGRSPRSQRFGDLATQVGLTAALGALQVACRTLPPPKGSDPFSLRGQTPLRFSNVINRLLDGTKTLLTEYF